MLLHCESNEHSPPGGRVVVVVVAVVEVVDLVSVASISFRTSASVVKAYPSIIVTSDIVPLK